MSRVGREPIPIPGATKVTVDGNVFTAEGPNGKVTQALLAGFGVEVREGAVHVSRPGDSGPERAKHGLLRSLLNNAVVGVAEGFTKKLEINGVGYRAEVKGNEVHFALGYSHPVVFRIPEGISVEVDKSNVVTVSGPDRQKVGQAAADIRSLRKPEPYKGKGIKYIDEVIQRKVGKAGAK